MSMVTDHPYQPGGPFGRCVEPACNRKKASHEGRAGAPTTRAPKPAPPPKTPEIVPDALRYTIVGLAHSPDIEPVLPRGGGLAELISPITPLVVIRRRIAVGKHETETVAWPPGWPLPAIGQSVTTRSGLARVRDVTFDLEHNQIVLACD